MLTNFGNEESIARVREKLRRLQVDMVQIDKNQWVTRLVCNRNGKLDQTKFYVDEVNLCDNLNQQPMLQ